MGSGKSLNQCKHDQLKELKKQKYAKSGLRLEFKVNYLREEAIIQPGLLAMEHRNSKLANDLTI